MAGVIRRNRRRAAETLRRPQRAASPVEDRRQEGEPRVIRKTYAIFVVFRIARASPLLTGLRPVAARSALRLRVSAAYQTSSAKESRSRSNTKYPARNR